MKKILLLLPLGFFLHTAHATEASIEIASPFSANLTLASQYVSRGFQQTWGKPAIQGGIDYNHDNGFYAGTWASTVSDHFIRDASVEWDVYTGYSRSFGDLTLGTKVAYYYYPGAKTTAETGNTRFDYGEIIPEISYGPLSVKYSITYTQDYFGNNSDTLGIGTNKHSRGSGYLDVSWHPFLHPLFNQGSEPNGQDDWNNRLEVAGTWQLDRQAEEGGSSLDSSG